MISGILKWRGGISSVRHESTNNSHIFPLQSCSFFSSWRGVSLVLRECVELHGANTKMCISCSSVLVGMMWNTNHNKRVLFLSTFTDLDLFAISSISLPFLYWTPRMCFPETRGWREEISQDNYLPFSLHQASPAPWLQLRLGEPTVAPVCLEWPSLWVTTPPTLYPTAACGFLIFLISGFLIVSCFHPALLSPVPPIPWIKFCLFKIFSHVSFPYWTLTGSFSA